MLLTSSKVQREMGAGELQLFPTQPKPQPSTPYIDVDEFEPILIPDDVPAVVWERAKPEIQDLVNGIVKNWQPKT